MNQCIPWIFMNSMPSLVNTIYLILYLIPSIRNMHLNIIDIFRNTLNIEDIWLISWLNIIALFPMVNYFFMISNHFL